jgi:hypothetical protein
MELALEEKRQKALKAEKEKAENKARIEKEANAEMERIK